MREDQRQRLKELQEKLADVFLDEADPDSWPGLGLPSAQLSADDRKERYLYKRAACETAMLLTRAQALAGEDAMGGEAKDERQSGIESDIGRMEKQAAKMLEAAMMRAKAKPQAHGTP
jgi:cell division septum initiation protein DivIVA